MSISGSVNLMENGKIKKSPTPGISDADYAAIQAHMKAKGLSPKFVNMGVVKPVADEAESRKLFAAAKKLGIDVLVAEPETHGKMEELPAVMDVVEKLAKEYNIKVAIHNHPGPASFYWKPDTVLAAVKGRSPVVRRVRRCRPLGALRVGSGGVPEKTRRAGDLPAFQGSQREVAQSRTTCRGAPASAT